MLGKMVTFLAYTEYPLQKHFSLQLSVNIFMVSTFWVSQEDKIRSETIFVIFDKLRISLQEGQEETTQVSFLVTCHFPVRKP